MKRNLLTPMETAKVLRCSLPRVYALSSQGMLAKYKIGGRLFFAEADVDAYVDDCLVEKRRSMK